MCYCTLALPCLTLPFALYPSAGLPTTPFVSPFLTPPSAKLLCFHCISVCPSAHFALYLDLSSPDPTFYRYIRLDSKLLASTIGEAVIRSSPTQLYLCCASSSVTITHSVSYRPPESHRYLDQQTTQPLQHRILTSLPARTLLLSSPLPAMLLYL